MEVYEGKTAAQHQAAEVLRMHRPWLSRSDALRLVIERKELANENESDL